MAVEARRRRGSKSVSKEKYFFNPSAWGLLKSTSYCDVGRFFYRVFKF
jgi:hypothetical protein